ncbi:MAG: hypothetical protein J07HQX50_02227 [Haloquadratum sp. J07HQX50]|nr:MAG: hypothetical protein J07HQX50_02227 [Haloquadratum sp. J07HQX50]
MMNNPTLSEYFICSHVGDHSEIITFFAELGGQAVR